LNDTKWRAHALNQGSVKWEEIAYWTARAKQFKKAYSRPNETDKGKLILKQQFNQFHYNFLQTASEEFATFSTRWLENMPELETEFVVNK